MGQQQVLSYIDDFFTMNNMDIIDSEMGNGLLPQAKLFRIIEKYFQRVEQPVGFLLAISMDSLSYARSTLSASDFNSLWRQYGERLIQRSPGGSVAGCGLSECIVFCPGNGYDQVAFSVILGVQEFLSEPYVLPSGIRYSLDISIVVYPIGLFDDGRESMTMAFSRLFSVVMKQRMLPAYDRIYVTNASVVANVDSERLMQIELRSAIHSQCLSTVYQPIIDYQSRKTVGYEVLSRWSSQKLGNVPPIDFITAAETSGLIHDLTFELIRKVAQDIPRLNLPKNGYVSINLSASTLQSDVQIARLLEFLKDYTDLPLAFEVTETVVLGRFKSTRVYLQMLRDMGFSISLDDFGTGYSSLNVLTQLPIDTLKVDRSFIKALPNRTNVDKVVLKAMVDIARAAQLRLIIEGIETWEEAEYLSYHVGSFYAQGYYFGAPEPLNVLDPDLHESVSA